MGPSSATAESSLALAGADHELTERALRAAVARARRTGRPTLVSVACRLPHDTDPCEVAIASRRPGESWFAFEQPQRGATALAALGEAAAIEARGARRFESVTARWRELTADAIFACTEGAAPSGALALGGFAFAEEGGASPEWGSFAPASLTVPEIALTRRCEGTGLPAGLGCGVHMILSALAAPDDTAEELLQRLTTRVAELRHAPLPLLDPAPVGRVQVSSPMPPEHYEAAVARAVELIGAGQLEKVVLAREVQVHAPGAHDPGAVFGALREEFPSCFTFCVGRGEATFVAASPELLLRREGRRVSTLALAGSTRRSADPAVDAHLGERLLRSEKDREEQAIVARRIERALHPHALWVAATPEPTLVRVANIQHLATPIRAQLARPLDATELLALMHPTPAVGGEPIARAAPLIPALEGLDRGWYAGPVGWTDASGDGEFCVALRCALLRANVARCYAGVGVVRDSDPAAELAETEIKLAALLPLLSS